MSRKTKKESLGKRLWHSITEPIPDENEEQDSEQIPLAYDLKDSAVEPKTENQESQAAKADNAKSQSSTDAESAASQATQIFYPKSEEAASQATQVFMPKSAAAASQATKVFYPQSMATSENDNEQAVRSVAKAVKTGVSKTSSADDQSTSTVEAGAGKTQRPRSRKSQTVASSVDKTSEAVTRKHVAKSVESAANAVSNAEAHQVTSAATSVADQEPRSGKRTVNRLPADNVSMPKRQQPRIVVHDTKQMSDEDQPELPLSREELYGDQQPNGGKEPTKPEMSRVERHGEQAPTADETQAKASGPDEPENSHLKKAGHHYSWKLMLTGVAILVVAAGGALFMWNHAQTTQAAAKSNAETIVNSVYTSTAQRDLKASASTAQLKQLQTSIDDMKNSSEKDTLQKQHDYAVKMLAVRTSYENLRNAQGLIKSDVTTATITKAQQRITTAGLTSDKKYFANKYDQKYTTTGKVVKKVVSYDAAYQKLYNKKNKLKSSTASTTVDKVLANLKSYRKQSQLAATDYSKLLADRKKLAQTSSSSATSSSVESYSEVSSSTVYSSSSDSSSDDYSSATSSSTDYGNDTATSSAASSSTVYSSSSAYSSSTGADTTGTSSTTTNNTTGYSNTTGTN
ncbi:hypothetical protein [Lactiplantibacillus herbarum]|uniref:hypothetical protein n=1 Tax=Lactiplantibacillus herbarum TaxID=1670446 RepID=UPI00064E4680